MNDLKRTDRHILSIDLKSFFASCECILRGLDPFSFPLVVANPKQGKGAMTLAVTPYLKKQGVPSRGRLYEIPNHISYQVVPPRMRTYILFSEKVISVYLDFVAKEDLYVYSIDECFLDVTSYLSLYKKSDYELAKEILQEITKRTGLTATCGIGPNILLAKVAMDIEAKQYKNGIAKWSMQDVYTKLWPVSPLSKMWGIGKRMEKKLNALGIFSIGDLACYDKNKLKEIFGVIGVELWEHAHGIDCSIIKEMNTYSCAEKSFSYSQILFKDYTKDNIGILIQETVDVICKRLRSFHMQCSVVGLSIGYSKQVGGGFYHVMKLDSPTDSNKVICEVCYVLFRHFYGGQPIRKVGVRVSRLRPKTSVQLNLFEDIGKMEQEDYDAFILDTITKKFGKNSILRASSLLENSTIRERNKKIGGHYA